MVCGMAIFSTVLPFGSLCHSISQGYHYGWDVMIRIDFYGVVCCNVVLLGKRQMTMSGILGVTRGMKSIFNTINVVPCWSLYEDRLIMLSLPLTLLYLNAKLAKHVRFSISFKLISI